MRQHYIGCLFTSRRYGNARDPPERILRATGPAMRHLMRLVAEEEERGNGEAVIKEVRMCRINAGMFAVPWERSKKAIEGLELAEAEVPQCAEEGVVKVVAYERE
jgi:ADP-ribose 1''-phosphate phosphatase